VLKSRVQALSDVLKAVESKHDDRDHKYEASRAAIPSATRSTTAAADVATPSAGPKRKACAEFYQGLINLSEVRRDAQTWMQVR
jgi:hypothetical protein